MAFTIINELLQQRNILNIKFNRTFDAQMEIINIHIGRLYTQLYINLKYLTRCGPVASYEALGF
jgi:hypothetical protein